MAARLILRRTDSIDIIAELNVCLSFQSRKKYLDPLDWT